MATMSGAMGSLFQGNPLREIAASNTLGRVDPGPAGNWVGTGNQAEIPGYMAGGSGALDPLAVYAAMAQGAAPAQAQQTVEDPLTRALAYAQQQQAQLGSAPQMDMSYLADQLRGQDLQARGQGLMDAEYVPNSGALGAIAQMYSTYKGKKLAEEGQQSIADALRAQAEQEAQAAQYADKRKAFDEGWGAIIQRTEQAQVLGLEGQAAQEYVLTGKLPRNAAGPTSLQEFRAAQEDPAFADFLSQRDAKRGTQVNVSLPPGQKAFDVELGKKDAQTYAGWRDNAVQAQRTLDQLGNVEQILALQQTGKAQEALALAGQYFGTEAGANIQALKGAIQPIVLSQVRQLGSGNGITDADRQFIEAGMPGFGNDPRANERVVRIMRQSAQANINLYNEADDYLRQNDSLRGFRPTVAPAPAAGGGSGAADSGSDPLGIR